MKVGIVTHYYHSENYGGNLQAYALCRVVQGLGHEVEQISYKRPKAKGFLRFVKRNLLKAKDNIRFCTARNLKKRRNAFLSFNDSIPHSEVYEGDAIYDCGSRYDAFITGSDQVWHPYAVCDAYLLKFAPPNKIKLSYAASVAKDSIGDNLKRRYASALATYNAVSVREENAVPLIQELCKQSVELTLDPTLLLTKENWLEIAEPSGIDQKYAFCYFLGDSAEQRRLVEAFAKKNNLKIVTLPHLLGKARRVDNRFGDIKLYDVTPKRLLSLINDAEVVFTDSFHATVFSCLFEKKFFVFHRAHHGSMSSRIYTLCELFGTQKHFCDTGDKLSLTYVDSLFTKDMSFDTQRLISQREKSIKFLMDNLKEPKLPKKIEINEPSLCSGCHACFNACPKSCISMLEDGEGFLYPTVDSEKCVLCGACVSVCPVINPIKTDRRLDDVIAYGAYNKDEKIREKSSSGGIFTLLAEKIINEGGVVYGAAFNSDFSVSHQMAQDIDELAKFRGSKYVQSTVGTTYADAKKQLEQGRKVLFTGTPCQIGGLYAYLKKDYDNLYTQDIICHGVPSPKAWQSYLEQRKKNADADTLSSACFKDKSTGWKTYSIALEFDGDKRYAQRASSDPMMRAFIANLCLRPSCHSCAFKTKVRQSDITLADYWGADKIIPKWDDDKGLSLVIVNSNKGKKLFDAIKNGIEYIPTDFGKAISYNSCMYKSSLASPVRDNFMRDIDEYQFDKVAEKYLVTPKKTLKRRLKNIIKKMLRRLTR